MRLGRSSFSSPRTLRRIGALALASVVVVTGVVVTGSTGASATATAVRAPFATPAAAAAPIVGNCPDVLFVGARGSSEVDGVNGLEVFGGMGPNTTMISKTVQTTLQAANPQLTYATMPVVYPANSFMDFVPSALDLAYLAGAVVAPAPFNAVSLGLYLADYLPNHWQVFLGGIDTGAAATITEMSLVATACPKTSFILGAYSQGAMVVHDAEVNMLRTGRLDLTSRIVGTVLVGDGDRVSNTAAHDGFGTSPHSGQGVRSAWLFNTWADVLDPDNTANVCNDGDIVCDFNLPSAASGLINGRIYTHTQYTTCPSAPNGICGTDPGGFSESDITKVAPALINGSAYIANKVAKRFPKITSTAPPAAKVGRSYGYQLGATNGQWPYNWALLDPLPAGLRLSGASISGTPTSVGTSLVRVRTSDLIGRSATATLRFVVTH